MDPRWPEESPEPRDLLIFPCNGNGVEALDCLGTAHRFLGFIDDTPAKQGTGPSGHPVFSRAALHQFPHASVLAVPGGPASYRARQGVIGGLSLEVHRFATVIHPSAQVSPLATIGCNVLLMAGVVVTSNAVIGDHVCVLPNTVIHHDARIGVGTLIGSNATVAGNTSIGENCYIGSGSTIMNGLEIGDRTLVALGSNVIRSLPAESKVAGNPARQLR